jgi:ADP-ribosylglycohydrolase
MLGAIAGDIIGSGYEFRPTKDYGFEMFLPMSRFTDDTAMSVAVADVLLHGGTYEDAFRKYGSFYPRAGYGGMFARWLRTPDMGAYNSFGNGSGMRVSPVGWAFGTLDDTLFEAERSALPTHNHPEGIKGAQAIAGCIFLARTGASKDEIKAWAESTFNYNLNVDLNDIRPTYKFDVTCQGSVPYSIVGFLESTSYEDCVRRLVSLGGDADTQGAMGGGIAEAFYGELPEEIRIAAWDRLDHRIKNIVKEFRKTFMKKGN